MKRCPKCNKAYSDFMDHCPDCNIPLSGNVTSSSDSFSETHNYQLQQNNINFNQSHAQQNNGGRNSYQSPQNQNTQFNQSSRPAGAIFCSKCGAANNENSKFCCKCGNEIIQSGQAGQNSFNTVQSNPWSNNDQGSSDDTNHYQSMHNQYDQSVQGIRVSSPDIAVKKTRKILLILVIIFCACLIALGVIFSMMSKEAEGSKISEGYINSNGEFQILDTNYFGRNTHAMELFSTISTVCFIGAGVSLVVGGIATFVSTNKQKKRLEDSGE